MLTLVYVGWIGGREIDDQTLRDHQIDVGAWNPATSTFDRCVVPEKAMKWLNSVWVKKWIFGLKREFREIVIERISEDDDIPF